MHAAEMAAYNVLECTFKNILDVIKPLQEDLLMRVKLIEDIQDVVKSMDTLRGGTVEPFGSFVSNLYTRWGDLDVSIMLTDGSHISFPGKKRKQNLLGDLIGALRQKGLGRRLRFISDARVPILQLEYGYPGISCDISIGNLQGQMKSKFLYWISGIDGRFRDMVLLVKEWAKAHDINNPKFGTFNSYSLSLLVIFHFQTCSPAILPPLKDIYPGNAIDDLRGVRSDAERLIEETCRANILKYRSKMHRKINRSSLSELFASFLAKFSDIILKAQEFGVCTFTGRWEDIRSNTRWLPRTYALYIEDPFEQPENTARAVSAGNLRKITEAFQTTYNEVISPHNQISLLCSLVGPKVSRLITGTPSGNPGYSYGGTHPQHSRAVHVQTQLQHRPLNGRQLDDSTSNRSSVTKWRPEYNLSNLTKQRQDGHSSNSAKQRPAQRHKNQAQPMWRPKYEKSNA